MAGGNDFLRDSMSGNNKVGQRMTVHKDKKGRTEVPYSSGHTLTWEKTEVGDGKRLKEVRTLIKTESPHEAWISFDERYADRYDKAFQKGIYSVNLENEGDDK